MSIDEGISVLADGSASSSYSTTQAPRDATGSDSRECHLAMKGTELPDSFAGFARPNDRLSSPFSSHLSHEGHLKCARKGAA